MSWMASPTHGHEFEQTPGDGEGGLASCSPWGCKESDRTEWLNNNHGPQAFPDSILCV